MFASLAAVYSSAIFCRRVSSRLLRAEYDKGRFLFFLTDFINLKAEGAVTLTGKSVDMHELAVLSLALQVPALVTRFGQAFGLGNLWVRTIPVESLAVVFFQPPYWSGS